MKTKLILIIFLSTCLFIRAQETQQLLSGLLKGDSAAVTALALYPESIRKKILEACVYPEALVRIESLQKSTSESFRKLLGDYPKDEQQKVWDLLRYPGLMGKITEGGKKTKKQLDKIASGFPEEIRETAKDYGISHYDLLVKVHSLNGNYEKAFEALIGSYPEPARSAYYELVKHPEVIDLLISDMKMSVLVGDIYKRQPDVLQKTLDSISAEHAKQNAKDLEDWKSGLEKDPVAKKEMEDASKEFTKELGYSEEELVVRHETVVVDYIIYPYPYWCGYPWWYEYPYWYPYPYWYDLGYYWGPYGIVYIGFPSPYFTFWFFHHHHHHYYYNHFSSYCVGHYYGHRGSNTGFHREVDRWVDANKQNLPKDFFANDSKRPDRIKEFGQFEMDYEKAVKNNPGKNISREDFLKSNTDAYPNINPVLNEPHPTPDKSGYDKPVQPPVKQEPTQPRPIIKVPQEPKPDVKPHEQPKQPKQVQPYPQPKPPQPKPPQPQPSPKPKPPKQNKNIPKNSTSESNLLKDDFSRMNEAGNYHRSKWNSK